MIIAFTGHRDKITNEDNLARIANENPGATWIHGGNRKGFDAQVQDYAINHSIPTGIFYPDYNSLPPRIAPLIRDRDLVDRCDILIACYDGRSYGGTYYTWKYAKGLHKEIIIVDCIDIPKKRNTYSD